MPGEQSILLRLEAEGRAAPRVRLREAEEAPSVGPVQLRDSGRFEVLGQIAQGGVGQILKGRDSDLGRDVALKVLRERHAESPEIIQRFVDEAQISGQLQHPGIVPVYELGLHADKRPFFAMKLVKGRTLAAMLQARRDPADDRRRFLQIFEQVCQTVAYAHARGVIHRDLKPSNVMVGAFGEVQVLDWGFAKVLPRGGIADERPRPEPADITRIATSRSVGEGSESIPGSVMGTPAYMPPEQALGQVELLDERSDVFSLGAILCEILTGQPPYTGAPEELLLHAAQARLDDAFARLDRCSVDEALVRLAKQSLSPMRQERAQDASILAGETHDYLGQVEERTHRSAVAAVRSRGQAMRARQEARDQHRARRHSIMLAATIVVALVISGGSYAWLEHGKRERQDRSDRAVASAVQEAQHLRGEQRWAEARTSAEQAAQLAKTTDVDSMARDRAQRLLATVAREEAEAREAAAQQARDAAFLARLEEVRLEAADNFPSPQTDRDYETAFRDYGIDIDTGPVDEAVSRIGARGKTFAIEIATVLDDWARMRRTREQLHGTEWRGLAAIARRVDPDPWQNRLREAAAAEDVDTLRELARGTEIGSLPVRSVVRLAVELTHHDALDEAIALLRQAYRVHPDDLWINRSLAHFLFRLDPPRWEDGFRHLLAGIALRPRSAHLRWCLGSHHADRDEWDQAVAAYRDSIRLKPGYWAYTSLGKVLGEKGLTDEAIESFRAAIRLRPDHADAHQGLGIALKIQGRYDEAIAALKEAIRLDPTSPRCHNALAVTLEEKGLEEEAIAEYREAIRVGRDDFQAYVNLGIRFYQQGEFREGLKLIRRAHEIGPHPRTPRKKAERQRQWTATWLARCERMVSVDAKLTEVLAGKRAAASALERTEFATVCYLRKRFAAAAGFSRDALVEEPALAEDLLAGHRYKAACEAVLTGCGKGEDADTMDDDARARWRMQALAWLRADLELRKSKPVKGWPLQHCLTDRDLAGVRDEAALAKLPAAERARWRAFWKEVEEAISRATDQ